MDLSGPLKNLRKDGYKQGAPQQEDSGKKTMSRIVKLSDDEMKSLEPYQVNPGEEIVLEMTGRLEDSGHFTVMGVKYASGGMDQGAEKVAGIQQPAPTVRTQTMPYPS
jgi:hypothetical protein